MMDGLPEVKASAVLGVFRLLNYASGIAQILAEVDILHKVEGRDLRDG
jgi:hypothetical protein